MLKKTRNDALSVCSRGILTVVGFLLLLNSILMAIFTNFNSGTIFTAVAGLVALAYGIFFRKLSKIKLLNYILACGLTLLCCLIAIIAIYGKADNATYNEDALIVLGAAIMGEEPSYPLYMRLEAAVAYNSRNPEAVIVVSGGQGFQETITEAQAMERHLVRRGVSLDKIIKEEEATSTYENFSYSKDILDKYFDSQYNIAFVTSDFHILRASITAKSLGLAATHCQAPILWYTMPQCYLRECAAVLKELLIRR